MNDYIALCNNNIKMCVQETRYFRVYLHNMGLEDRFVRVSTHLVFYLTSLQHSYMIFYIYMKGRGIRQMSVATLGGTYMSF